MIFFQILGIYFVPVWLTPASFVPQGVPVTLDKHALGFDTGGEWVRSWIGWEKKTLWRVDGDGRLQNWFPPRRDSERGGSDPAPAAHRGAARAADQDQRGHRGRAGHHRRPQDRPQAGKGRQMRKKTNKKRRGEGLEYGSFDFFFFFLLKIGHKFILWVIARDQTVLSPQMLIFLFTAWRECQRESLIKVAD